VAKILVADDNSNIQKMVGLALKDQGIDVVAVGNGEAAVRKISDVRPDLVLADVFMPVRNGYEVCEYVKQDSSLAHIPVILLVGAFDPLDEQEAQRVGADGVLKKPFVPPDPLISMVKSALARAGVSLGTEDDAARGLKKGTDTLAPAASADAGNAPPPMPHATEEFPEVSGEPLVGAGRPAAVKFDTGDQPLAFGSLLETPGVQEEDDSAFLPPARTDLGPERDWRSDDVDEEEVEEEETAKGSWRRDAGGDESLEDNTPAGRPPDWRETAFEAKPAQENAEPLFWTPVPEKPQVPEVVAAEEHASNVATDEKTPPAPFAGDAWAAAISSVTEKPAAGPFVVPSATTAAAPADQPELPKQSDAWKSAASNPWEAEAQKANQLAATWDAPAVLAPVVAHEELTPSADAENAIAAKEIAAFEGASKTSDAPAVLETDWSKHSTAAVAEGSLSQATVEAIREEATHLVDSAPAETLKAEPSPEAAESDDQALDDLVAKVLAKMNPEILQAVTREILRPVIEAVVREEIKPKKP